MSYKQQKTVIERRAEFEKIRKNTPNRIPVICEKAGTNKTLVDLPKRKMLLQPEMGVGQFSAYLAKELGISAETALFLFVNNATLISPSFIMGMLYEKYKDKDDGFLYITYNSENTFGLTIS